jgi:hypothetical protein
MSDTEATQETRRRRRPPVDAAAENAGFQLGHASTFLLELAMDPILTILQFVTLVLVLLIEGYPGVYFFLSISSMSWADIKGIRLYIHLIVSFAHTFLTLLLIVNIPRIARQWKYSMMDDARPAPPAAFDEPPVPVAAAPAPLPKASSSFIMPEVRPVLGAAPARPVFTVPSTYQAPPLATAATYRGPGIPSRPPEGLFSSD